MRDYDIDWCNNKSFCKVRRSIIGGHVMLEKFVSSYQSNINFDKVSFKWNGKHADEFEDENDEFRREVAEFIINSVDDVCYELLRDIFIEEAKWAKEAWGTSNVFPLIGEKLLRVGQEHAILDFLAGYVMSFDTFACCHTIDLSGMDLERFVKFINEQITDEKNKEILNMLEAGKELFSKHLEGNASEGWVALQPGTHVQNIKVIHPLSARIKFFILTLIKRIFRSN